MIIPSLKPVFGISLKAEEFNLGGGILLRGGGFPGIKGKPVGPVILPLAPQGIGQEPAFGPIKDILSHLYNPVSVNLERFFNPAGEGILVGFKDNFTSYFLGRKG
jgi:hypothetical protein